MKIRTLRASILIIAATAVVGRPQQQDFISFTSDGGAIFRGAIQSATGSSSFDEIKVQKDLLIANGKVIGKSIQMESIEAKEIVAKSKLRVNGVLNVTSDTTIAGKLEARGQLVAKTISSDSVGARSITAKKLDVSEKMNVKGTLRAEEGEFVKELKANDLQVKGTLRCSGKESLVTTGSVQMNGLEAATITTKNLKVKENLDAASLTVSGKDNRKARLDVLNGTVRTSEVISTDSISTPMLKCDASTVKKMLQTQNLTVHEFAKIRNVNVSMEAHVRQLSVDSMDVNKKLKVSGGVIVAMNGIHSKHDCKVEGTLISNKGRFKEGVGVAGVLTADEIVAKKNITVTGTLISKAIDIKDGHAKNFNVDKLFGNTITAEAMVVDQSFTSKGEFKAINNATVNGMLTVNGALSTASAIYSEGYIHAKGDLRSTNNVLVDRNATVNGNMQCHGTIQTPFATITNTLKGSKVLVENLNISEMLIGKEARFGADGGVMKIESNSVSILSNLIGSNASFDGIVNADNITTSSISVDNSITTNQLVSKNTIVVQHGDLNVTKGTIRASNAEINGNMTTNTIKSFNIAASAVTCTNMLVEDAVNTSSITGITGHFDDAIVSTLTAKNVVVNGNITVAEGSAITSETINTQNFHASAVEVRDGVKATSFIGKRIYTEDITSSGYVTAQNLNVKGGVTVGDDFEVKGMVTVKTLMNAKDVKIENSLEATTARFGSFVEAGGMKVRKLNVNGELYLDGVDIGKRLKEMDVLQEKVDKLEALVAKLSSKVL